MGKVAFNAFEGKALMGKEEKAGDREPRSTWVCSLQRHQKQTIITII